MLLIEKYKKYNSSLFVVSKGTTKKSTWQKLGQINKLLPIRWLRQRRGEQF
jgi:hypothetical protein